MQFVHKFDLYAVLKKCDTVLAPMQPFVAFGIGWTACIEVPCQLLLDCVQDTIACLCNISILSTEVIVNMLWSSSN